MIAKSDLTILTLASAAVVVSLMKLGPPATPAARINPNFKPVGAVVESAMQPGTVTTSSRVSADGAAIQIEPVEVTPVDAGEITTYPTPGGETYSTHVVQSGESLSVIASRYDTTVNELMSLNQLNDFTIYVGQELRYPSN